METGTAETVRDLTPVLAEPAEGAEQVTEALPGEPLTVDERRDGWARIRTAYDYPGWISAGGARRRARSRLARGARRRPGRARADAARHAAISGAG